MFRSIPHISWFRTLLAFTFCVAVLAGSAQKTKVSGKVYDAETNEPLPFVNIAFKNSKIGTNTNLNGYFEIETYYATDSLVASFVGYKNIAKKIKKDVSQTIDFPMSTSSVQLTEFEVEGSKKDENPAHKILRHVIENKKANNREKLDAYEYEVYNKIEFDINNINESYKSKRVFKPFKFVFDYIDTTEAKDFLPLFMTESLSDHYYRKFPKAEKEIIKATKVSGVENESIEQFLGDMYQNVNLYENYITFFQKSFISPIADWGLFSYRYYLLDSTFIGSDWCYKIRFLPKRKHELTFAGDMWINDTTYAIRKIDVTMSGDANINYIHEFSVGQEYEQVEKEVWMLVKDKLVIDFAIANKAVGLYGRKTTSYKNFVINQPRQDDFYAGVDNIIIEEEANMKSEDYWNESRHTELTEKERNIYAMVDTIKQIPAFRTYYDIIFIFVTGYKVWGNFEIGPFTTLYSFNPIEGSRFRLGGRTSNKFSTRFMPEAYVAYGTLDQQFKYRAGFWFFLSKKPRQLIQASYANDVEQMGVTEEAWKTDNIISSVFRRNPNYKLNGYEQYQASYERDWFQGLSNKITLTHRNIRPVGDSLRFDYFLPNGSGETKNQLITAEVKIKTRFAFKECFLSGEFERISLGSKWPIFEVEYSLGLKDIFHSEYNYHKLVINIRDKIRINPFGFSVITVEGGVIWGDLPFPLLELHTGNETWGYDVTAFNLMNYYEFVSDEYISASITHHFNGLFLNKIPLMRKLKWREVASGKAVVGNLNPATRKILTFPDGLQGFNASGLSRPYYEAGIGIENMFKLLRLDAVWRLSYLANTNITKFAIRGMLQFRF